MNNIRFIILTLLGRYLRNFCDGSVTWNKLVVATATVITLHFVTWIGICRYLQVALPFWLGIDFGRLHEFTNAFSLILEKKLEFLQCNALRKNSTTCYMIFQEGNQIFLGESNQNHTTTTPGDSNVKVCKPAKKRKKYEPTKNNRVSTVSYTRNLLLNNIIIIESWTWDSDECYSGPRGKPKPIKKCT